MPFKKYLDSHLKPYRCTLDACKNNPFSSIATVLRHEREAHGMHGDNLKPHHRPLKHCDRSIEGNGFPRRSNLLDHLKRVHNDSNPSIQGSTSEAMVERQISGPMSLHTARADHLLEKAPLYTDGAWQCCACQLANNTLSRYLCTLCLHNRCLGCIATV